MNTLSAALSSLLLLASTASAQKTVPVKPIKGPVKSFQIGGVRPKSTSALVYSNTLLTGYYAVPGPGEEWLDWGVTRPAAVEHGTIVRGTFGYGSVAPLHSGPTIRWRTHDGYAGGCVSLVPGGLDLSISGLPGTIYTASATGWVIALDFAALCECFYLPSGPFGYSFTFDDSLSGPLLSSGDSASFMFDWVKASTGSCSPGWWSSVWCGFRMDLCGWKTSDTFGPGCHGPVLLSATGNSCPGGTLQLSLSGPGPDLIPFSAVGVGSIVGAGIGGPLPGGCAFDVGLGVGVPPATLILGLFPVGLVFGVNTPASAAPGTVLAAQWVQKDIVTGILSTSNVVEIFVP